MPQHRELIPAVQRHGNTVLLSGPAVLDVHYLAALGVRDVSRRDGIQPSARLRHLLDTLARTAADIRSGHGDGPEAEQSSQSSPLDPISTQEAAVILGLSVRQTRRLAADIGAHRGTRLTYDRAAVEACAHSRKENQA
ncbi:MAG: hypothetical protein JWO98_318 [Frankiales bacterium]|nr:hypothetical protein [Frankiales bacterium]